MIGMDEVYHISLAHGDSLVTVVIVFRDRTHRHRPGFDPGTGVVDVVAGLHVEVVALVSLAHEVGLGLGGVAQPGGPGAGDAHFVLHVVVTQAGLAVLPQPGDAEVKRGHGRRGDGHRGRDGILEEGEGLRGLVAGAVGGGDGQGGAQGVVGVEGIGVRAGCSGRAAPAVSRPGRSRLGEGQAEEAGQGVAGDAGEGEDAAPVAVVDTIGYDVAERWGTGQGQSQVGGRAIQGESLFLAGGDVSRPVGGGQQSARALTSPRFPLYW
jgi:hypothetical protein